MKDLDDLWPPFVVASTRRGDAVRPRRRRRDTALSRDEIVRVAVTLADAEGPDAVNMRRIAKELEVGAMSLYWHVTDKEHLLDLMLDAVEGEEAGGEPSGDWRTDFVRIARLKRASLLRHRWVVDFISGRPPFGPNMLLQIERSLAVLDGIDLETHTKLHILMTIDTYVTGAVLHELREIRAEQAHGEAGLEQPDIEARVRDWRERLNQSGLFVRVLQVFDEGIDPDAPETRDERFEFGLNCVLDGISAMLPSGTLT